MNVAHCIEDLMLCREAVDARPQGEPSLRYQQARLEQARSRLHAALSLQIRECLRDMTEQIANSNSHS